MDTKTQLSEVADILKNEGVSEDEVAKILEELGKQAIASFYQHALTTLTEEDLAVIDKVESDDEANYEIKVRYAERAGKSADDAIQEYLAEFAKGFLEKYKQDKAGTVVA